jgi:mRNA interferase MazF
MYQRGDIVSVPFPFTDLTQTKLRPALILSNEDVNSTGDVILAMITSVAKAEDMSLAVSNADVSIPLPKDSFVRYHKVVTMSESLILKTISKANADFVDKVADRVRLLIGDTPKLIAR